MGEENLKLAEVASIIRMTKGLLEVGGKKDEDEMRFTISSCIKLLGRAEERMDEVLYAPKGGAKTGRLSPEKLTYQMKRNMMNNRDLAGVTGLSLTTISDLRRGARPTPKPATMKTLADALHCTVEDLLEVPEQ